jgi:putative DNA methylase
VNPFTKPVLENIGAASMDLGPSRGDLVGRAQLMAGKPGYRFTVKVGKPKDLESAENGTKLARGANFKCLMSGSPIAGDYIKAQGKAGRIGARLMAIVAEGTRGRVYLAPTSEHETAALNVKPDWESEQLLPDDPRNFWTVQYGLRTYGDLFTDRQLVALTNFSDLVGEAMVRIRRAAIEADLPDDGMPLRDGGTGATSYAEAVGVYLGIAVSRTTNTVNALAVWSQSREQSVNLFSRQAIPMAWDFPEVSPFGGAAGDFGETTAAIAKSISNASSRFAWSLQADATKQNISLDKVVSADPPYYDNISYADLSDFFYVWLRRSLRSVYPDLFATLAVPKAEELVASPYRHGSRERAETFFLEGMTRAMHRLAEQGHPAFPVTIYYAFRQSETEGDAGTASTGWEIFLGAVFRAGFALSGTWPMRTERPTGVKTGTNALASSIILVCRPRGGNLPTATRRELVAALKAELPVALRHLQAGNIAPVDLAQAAIGPGMGVYTRYARVLDAEGKSVSVREALSLINATLDEALAEQEGDFDADSRWALPWFEQFGFNDGDYGVAEVLSKAKNTSIQAMTGKDGILDSRRGKVRLLRPDELPADWDPATDPRLTAWEVVHHLIRVLGNGGESATAALVAKLGARAEAARELAYRLYILCERKKRAAEALAYNGLVQSWPEIARLAADTRGQAPLQPAML